MINLEKYILEEKSIEKLRHILQDYHPYDLAQEFEKLSKVARMRLYEVLDSSEMADIFEYIEDPSEYIEEMYPSYTARMIDSMEVDDAADMLSDLEKGREHYLHLLSEESKKELEELIAYDDDEAGSAMTTGFITIQKGSDVKEAMRLLIKESREKEIIDPLFICEGDKLVGEISLKELIVARAPKQVNDIMEEAKCIDHKASRLEASQIIQDYGLYALAVVDEGMVLKGVITIDDAIDVIEEEAEEDYAKMALVSSEELNVFSTIKKRTPWLLILVALSFVVSSVLGLFIEVINKLTFLVFFQTLIMGMAGNSGTQSLAVTVRGISKGDFNGKNTVLRHLLKEFRIGFFDGLFLGILAFSVSLVFLTIANIETDIFMVSLVIASSMTVALIISNLLGAVMPLVFNKAKIDPAIASGPFISTLNDIIAITIYFSLASLLLLGV